MVIVYYFYRQLEQVALDIFCEELWKNYVGYVYLEPMRLESST